MSIKPLESIACPICENDQSSPLLQSPGRRCFQDQQFTVVRCRKCDLTYTNPRLSKDDLGLCYNETYYAAGNTNRFDAWFSAATIGVKATRLTRTFHRSGSTVLDIGCGSGEFLFQMKQRAWQTVGIDASVTACQLATQRLGQNIINSSLQDCQFPNSQFDLITLWHVFEHVYDPVAELREIKRVLKSNGALVLAVPNIDCSEFRLFKKNWIHLDLPVHVFHFSPASLTVLLQKSGFRVTHRSFFSLDFPLGMIHSARSGLVCSRRFKRYSKLILALATPLLLGATALNRLLALTQDSPVMEVWAQKQENSR